MIKIPPRVSVKILDESLEANQEQDHRSHLGASLIGHTCGRHIWYSFRWYKKEQFNGRMLRLFQRGHEEEDRFAEWLKQGGLEVSHVKPEPQLRFFLPDGHFSGEIDGVVKGLKESPNKDHVLEFKTYSHKSFLSLIGLSEKEYKSKRDVISFKADTKTTKPQHYAQMQAGMGLSGIDRAFYLAVNKNDDCIAYDRLRFSQKFYDSLIDKATGIIHMQIPPPKISENPSWFECKFCKFKDICHGEEQPEKNCRTCKHSKPNYKNGWDCQKYNKPITTEQQRKEYKCHEARAKGLSEKGNTGNDRLPIQEDW